MSLDYPYHLSRLLPLSIKIYGQQAKYCLSETQHCQNPMFQQFFLQRSIFNMFSFCCRWHIEREKIAPDICQGQRGCAAAEWSSWLILCSQRSDFTCNCAGVNAKYAYCVHWFLPTSGVACFRRKHISIFYFSVNSAGPWLSSLSSKTTCKLVNTAYCGVHCVYMCMCVHCLCTS